MSKVKPSHSPVLNRQGEAGWTTQAKLNEKYMPDVLFEGTSHKKIQHACFSQKWPVLAAKCHLRQKIIYNSVKSYDFLMK